MIWPLGTLQNCVAYRTFVLPLLPFPSPPAHSSQMCCQPQRERFVMSEMDSAPAYPQGFYTHSKPTGRVVCYDDIDDDNDDVLL